MARLDEFHWLRTLERWERGSGSLEPVAVSRGKRWHRIVQSISGIKATILKEFRTRDEALRFEMEQIKLLKPEANTRGLRRFEDYKKLPGMDVREAGRLGALATNKKLSKKKRRENARKAAQARWNK